MKKRILSLLLALCLCLSLLPAAVLAEDVDNKYGEGLEIDAATESGSWAAYEPDTDGTGTATYDKASHTLTLEDAQVYYFGTTTSGFGVYVDSSTENHLDVTIQLKGSSHLHSDFGILFGPGNPATVENTGTLTMQGDEGSSLILSGSTALVVKGDLTLKSGANVRLDSGKENNEPSVTHRNKVTGTLKVESGAFLALTGDAYGAYELALTQLPTVEAGGTFANNGHLYIENSSVTAEQIKKANISGVGLVYVKKDGESGYDIYTNTGMVYSDTTVELAETSGGSTGISSLTDLNSATSGYYWYKKSNEENSGYILVLKNIAVASVKPSSYEDTIKIIGEAYVESFDGTNIDVDDTLTIENGNESGNATFTARGIDTNNGGLTLSGLNATIGSITGQNNARLTLTNTTASVGSVNWTDNVVTDLSKYGLYLTNSHLTVTSLLGPGNSTLFVGHIVMDAESTIKLENAKITNYGNDGSQYGEVPFKDVLKNDLKDFLPNDYAVSDKDEFNSKPDYVQGYTVKHNGKVARNLTLQRHYNVTVPTAEDLVNGTVSASPTRAPKGETITVTATPATSYKLGSLTAAFGSDGTGIINLTKTDGKDNEYTFTMPAADVSVTASFEQNGYSVTVNPSEHGSVTANPSSGLNSGDTVTLTVTPSNGYELDTLTAYKRIGTEIDPNGALTVTPVSGATDKHQFTMPESDVTVVATFKAKSYNISYELNGGTINDGNVTAYTYGVGATLPNNVTRTGHTFAGWYDNQSCEGTAVTGIGTTETGIKTFYAKWTPDTYTVTYRPGTNGTGTETTATKTYGVDLPLKDATFTRTNYTQTGWATTENSTTNDYALGGTYTANESIILYPVWTANNYSITFNTNGGAINSGNITGYVYGIGATLPTDVTRTGHTFAGWYDNQSCNGTAVTGIGTTETGIKTFYAKWTEVPTYTVSYNAGQYGTGSAETQIKTHDVALTLRDVPYSRSGYTQTGWATTESSTTNDYALGGTYTANATVTLYPVWTQDPANDLSWLTGILGALDREPFDDVTSRDWFYSDVHYVNDCGLMTGTGYRIFSPDSPVTRGMVMTILARREGIHTEHYSPWYAAGVEWAVANGISDGTNPEQPITREELVTMLYRYAKLKGYNLSGTSLTAYIDAGSVSTYAVPAMQWAVANGLVTGAAGVNAGKLLPQSTATRAQLAAILHRFFG